MPRQTISHRLAAVWSQTLLQHPKAVVLTVLVLTLLSAFGASQLTINTNQLDLISQDLRQVKDVKRIIDMIGGSGHLILALRGKDEKRLKAVSDDINAMLVKDQERVRQVTYKVATEFLRYNAALFMKTEDLVELKRRVSLKLKDAVKRASPFFFEIRKTEPVKLELDDIIKKYSRVGKKSITDNYYISDDREMLLLLIKPQWDSNQLDRTGALVDSIRSWLTKYGQKNPHEARFNEEYSPELDPDPAVIEFGFSGSYKTNYDDSYAIKNSLVPVSGYAFLGVFAVLLLFFRRQFLSVLLVLSGLIIGVIITFGFAWVAIGELNMVTCILGGILMGLGIDFGIHQIYRLSEELSRGEALGDAIQNTIEHAGTASMVSAAGTAAAFFSLLFSEFAGFSHFGLLAGAGVFIIGAVIYLWVPALIILLERSRPGTAARLLSKVGQRASNALQQDEQRLPYPMAILLTVTLLALALGVAAPKVKFEYNTRALMVEDQASVLLQDEVNRRYQISADPVALYAPTAEANRAVFDLLHPLDRKRFTTVDQVVSMHSFVPPKERQLRNAKILEEWREELSTIRRASLPPDLEKKWDEGMRYLHAKPYTLEDVPELYRKMFTHLPSARPENHGFLTFLYPVVDLWDGRQMLHFAEEIEEVETKDGEHYYSAGMPILFAKLARIVLHDGRFSVALTALLLLIILLVDLRSPRAVSVALMPLVLGVVLMLGVMALADLQLNFMNVVVFPIVLGYGLSHGIYLIHRFREGASPMQALSSVGTAVSCSTMTTLAGWAALLAASHRGLKSMGMLACLGMVATLAVSFTIMSAVLQFIHDQRSKTAESNNG